MSTSLNALTQGWMRPVANERLRSVMQSAGFTTQKLAQELGVDPKTVER